MYTWIKPKGKYALYFLFFLCSFMLFVRWKSTHDFYKKIGDLPMIALKANGKNYVIDYGALCSKQNFYSNIDYSIIPELIKQTGITNIDTLILCKPSKRLTKVAMQFCTQTNVQTIIATTKLDCFKTLKVAYKNSNVKILPLSVKQKKSKPLLRTLL
jgi:hypothetical protein